MSIHDRTVYCNYCDAMVGEDDCYANKRGLWSWGQQGIVSGYGVSGSCANVIKHACPNPICVAKLTAWAHS